MSGTPRVRFRMVAMTLGAALAVAPTLVAGAPAGASAAVASCTDTSSIGLGSPPTTGAITAAGQVDCYRIFAKPGQTLRVRVVAASGALVPSTEVDGPNGAALCGPASATDQNCKVTIKGLQTIAIQDASGTNTGSYTVVVQWLQKPVGCGTLGFGSPSNPGSISVGDIACYTFRAPAGSYLFTRAVGIGAVQPNLEEINASGNTQCAPNAALEQNCRLLSGGKETLFVDDAAGPNGGQFFLYAQLTHTVTCTGIKFGQAVQASITSAGQTDCYKFTATGGDHMRITVASTSGALVTYTEVYKPNGTTFCANSSTPEQTCRLTSTGAHTVFVSDVTDNHTGDYTVYVQDLNAPKSCTPIQYGKHGDTHPDSISFPGAERCYSFQGTAGTGAHLKVTSTGGTWSPEFEIIQPNGTDPNPGYCDINATDERCVLGVTGTHIILVRDAAAKNTGTYDYSLTERTFT